MKFGFCYLLKRILLSKKINNSALHLNSVTKLFSWESGRIHGIFYSFYKDLGFAQYVLGLVEGSIIVFDTRQ